MLGFYPKNDYKEKEIEMDGFVFITTSSCKK
jgi:hypothetical protein